MHIDYIEAFFLDAETNELNIVTDAVEIPSYRLYWTYERDPQTLNKTPLFTGNEKNVTFDFAYDTKRRQYFIIEFDTGDVYLFGHRILPIAGMYNFRDIGGYLTRSGKRVLWGLGYRSDYLYNLDEAGLPYLLSLDLQTIIDFRSPDEVAERPNKDIGVRNFVFDPQAHLAKLAGALQVGSSEDDDEIMARAENEAAGDAEMILQQETFVATQASRLAFSNMLHTMANNSALPVMFHCRGGKDRTGFAAMLLLGLLGVDEQVLIYDYMLTHRAREKKNKLYYESFLAKTGDVDKAKYMFTLFDVKPTYVEAAMTKINAEYGSIKHYAQQALGVSVEEVKQLEEMFLA
jgi:protein-tyrosine phosphatase